MPDCSNMCHESTSIALAESIGIGKASVTMNDVYQADLILIAGQNPGTNHPRMLSALEIAKRRGAKIIAVNPLREAGLHNFRNPQVPRGIVGKGTEIADLHLPIRINGDLALFQAIGSLLVEWDALDHDFIDRTPRASRTGPGTSPRSTGTTVEEATGSVSRPDHRGGRDDPRLGQDGLLLGHGPDAAPQRGRHDQGGLQPGLRPRRHRQAGRRAVPDPRPLQRAGRPHDGHLGARRRRTSWTPCRPSSASTRRASTGYDTVNSVRAMRDGKAHVFVGLGGNFVQAAPDTAGHRQGAGQHPADGADLDQAQPLAPGVRRDRD